MKKSFEPELYKKVPIQNLILFAIHSIISGGKDCDFEKLIKECFDLFPQAFNFPKHPFWPDSRKLDRPLRTLRKQKLIKGSPQTSFSLTKAGQKMARDITKILTQGKLKF